MKDSSRIQKLRNRIIILGVVAVLLIVGYYFVYSSVASMKSQTAELENEAIVLQGQVDNAAALKRQYNEQSADRSKLESFILKKGGEADFISVIESLANDAGLEYQIQSVNLEPGTSAERLQNLHLKVDVSGSFRDIYQFLLLVENMPYSVTIANVNIATSGQVNASSSSPTWIGSFDLLVASFK